MNELTLVTKPTDLDLVDESTELSAESKPSSVIVIATMDPPCEVELKVERHDIVIETKKPEIVIDSKEFNIEFGTICPVGGGEENAGQNIGGGEELYIGKSGVLLDFRTLVAGTGIDLETVGDTVVIDSTGSDKCLANCLATDQIGDCVYVTGPRISDRKQVTKIDPLVDPPQIFTGVICEKTSPTECVLQIAGEYEAPYAFNFTDIYYVGFDGRISALPPMPRTSRECVAWQKIGHGVAVNTIEIRVGWDVDQRLGNWLENL